MGGRKCLEEKGGGWVDFGVKSVLWSSGKLPRFSAGGCGFDSCNRGQLSRDRMVSPLPKVGSAGTIRAIWSWVIRIPSKTLGRSDLPSRMAQAARRSTHPDRRNPRKSKSRFIFSQTSVTSPRYIFLVPGIQMYSHSMYMPISYSHLQCSGAKVSFTRRKKAFMNGIWDVIIVVNCCL